MMATKSDERAPDGPRLVEGVSARIRRLVQRFLQHQPHWAPPDLFHTGVITIKSMRSVRNPLLLPGP